jgi:glycosyltransferase involved in cell wall biosynthesis
VAAADLVRADRSFVVPVPVTLPPESTRMGPGKSVLFLGRVTAKKRLDLLAAAWPLVLEQEPTARLVIAGPVDTDQHAVVDAIAQLPGVSVPGLVTGADKDALLSEASVFVLPSDNENFGVAVVEAMAHGVPVIVTPSVATAESIRDEGAGEVLTSTTPRSIATAVRTWLTSPDQREAAGHAGRSLVAREFSPQSVGAELKMALEHAVTT